MTTTSLNRVTIPGTVLAAAVRALLRAARFTEATALLDAADATRDPTLALVRVEATLAHDWLRGEPTDLDVLRAAEPIITESADPHAAWTLDYLHVRRDYAARLLTARGEDDHADLVRRATALRDAATDDADRGWTEFTLGLIADNLAADPATARAHFHRALELAERQHDDLMLFESLRHLGHHAREDGDAELARERWERSAHHAARAGAVSSTLAQQLLLAVLARDHGDDTAARLLAREINRWAGAIDATRTAAAAAAFVTGQDPTRESEQGG